MASKRQNMDHGSGPGTKKANMAAPFKFIAFQKSGGGRVESGGDAGPAEPSSAYTNAGPQKTVSDIDLSQHIGQYDLDMKQKFVDRLREALAYQTAESAGTGCSDTTLLSMAAQLCKTNPSYQHASMAGLSPEDIPAEATRRRLAPGDGFICEIRIQGIFFAVGCGVSKPGSKDRASENAVNLLRSRMLFVVPVQRRWRDKNYPEFALSRSISIRPEVPPFYQPPEGTEEHKMKMSMERRRGDWKRGEATDRPGPNLGFMNVAHMGPPYSGKPLENFVILLFEDNPISVMNSSAQFCKMAVDYYFEMPRAAAGNDFIVTLFIEGIPVADCKGPKKLLKYQVSELALRCLNQFCYTVLTNNQAINSWSTLTRNQIKGSSGEQQQQQQGRTLVKDERGEDSVGAKMMKLMGWTEGSAIGDRFKGRLEPVQIGNESMNREGLGSQAIDSDKITRDEAEEIVRTYASSNRVDDLVFSSELNFEERKELRMMAKRFGLTEKMAVQPAGRGKRVFLVLSKKMDSRVIIEELLRDGKFGRYELVYPAGYDSSVTMHYLKYQHLRKSQGCPPELMGGRGGAGRGGARRGFGFEGSARGRFGGEGLGRGISGSAGSMRGGRGSDGFDGGRPGRGFASNEGQRSRGSMARQRGFGFASHGWKEEQEHQADHGYNNCSSGYHSGYTGQTGYGEQGWGNPTMDSYHTAQTNDFRGNLSGRGFRGIIGSTRGQPTGGGNSRGGFNWDESHYSGGSVGSFGMNASAFTHGGAHVEGGYGYGQGGSGVMYGGGGQSDWSDYGRPPNAGNGVYGSRGNNDPSIPSLMRLNLGKYP